MSKSKITMKKFEGDDLYSWAVFVNGVPKWTSMSRDEAAWRLKKEKEAKK